MTTELHDNDPGLDLEALVTAKVATLDQPVITPTLPRTEEVEIDLGGDNERDDMEAIAAEDPVYDPLYKSPIIERILTPYKDLTDLLHVAHGDQVTIGDVLRGIDASENGSIETEMFREMVRQRGAEVAMEWLGATQNAINHMAYKNGLTDTVQRKDSRWLQGILIDDRVVGANRPNVKNGKHKKGERLTGKEAMIRVRQEMKIGDFINIPCPHTGIWITLLVAGEDEMVNFHTRILTTKSVLGRRTAGLVFSNSDTVIMRHLWDLIHSMIVNTSLGGSVNKKELANLIRVQDIPLIVSGYMAARFSSGYPLAQPCQIDPTKCNDISISKVNINRMTIIDNARLTDVQRAHMRNRNGHTVEAVLAYQEYFSAISKNVRLITPGVRVVLTAPSIDQKQKAGDAWIDSIEDAVTLSFKDTMTRDERVQYISKQASVSALRNYAHWVARIDYLDADGELDGFIEGENDIYEQLTELSKDEVFKAAFYKEISSFINDMTVGIVAVPRYTCPACKQRQPAVNGHFPDFTAVNIERCFFTLLSNMLATTMNSADI